MEESMSVSRGEISPAWKRSRILTGVETAISKVEGTLNIVGVALIMILMFLTVADIIGRYVFLSPILGAVEISELIMAPIVMFGIAYTQRIGGNVRFGLFIERVPKGRAYHITESISLIVCLLVFTILTFYSLKTALFNLEIKSQTGMMLWPTWPSHLCIPIGGFLVCIRFAIQLIQHTLQAVSGIEKRELA